MKYLAALLVACCLCTPATALEAGRESFLPMPYGDELGWSYKLWQIMQFEDALKEYEEALKDYNDFLDMLDDFLRDDVPIS